MKKIFLPLLILLAFSAGAQIPGATKINSRYEWLAGRFLQLKLPIYADTSQYPLWIPRLAGDVMLDTAGTDAGTVYVRYGQPPYWQAIKGDGSGGGGTDSLYTTLIGALGVEFLSSITGDSVSVYVTPYRNVDSLRKVSGAAAGQGASTLGYASPGDGGGASYWWDASSIATDDGGSIIDPIASGSGRWRLVINNGFLNPRQFGAKSGDGLDDYAAFQAANAFADSPNLTIEVPEGQFNLSTTLQLRDGVSLVGTSWVGSYINSLTSDTLIRMGSTCIVKNVYLRGADIGTVGLVMNDGSSMLVENVRFERFVLDGLLALVTNNSKVTNIKTQYNGRAQLRAVGTLNTDFTNIQANTDDAFNGIASTRGIYFEGTRNCHIRGGIIERGPGDAQGEFVANDHLMISEIEFNNGKIGILVSGGTVTLDHVQFSNPIDFAAWAKNGGTINIINNGSPMVSGANGRPLPYLFRGNILYNGSGMFPIFSSNLRGSVSGSTIGSGTTLAFDSARANVVVSTTLAAAGISIGLGSSVYNTSPGQGFQYRVFIKNIAATNKRLALYVGLVGGSRRFISYLKPGYNVKNYIARGDETYRFNILSPQSGTNSWYMSLSELWLTSSDSLALTDSIPNTDGVMEFAMDTASRDPSQVFSAADVHKLVDGVIAPGGSTAKTQYLLFSGQSNANGNNVGNYDTASNPKVLGWNPTTNTWATMRRGVFPMGMAFPGVSWSAAGYGSSKDTATSMAFYFAKRLQEQTGDTIKVFLLAWGANSINEWLPGGAGNYDYIKAELASAGNPKLNYFGWHQGESDNGMVDTTYKPKFDSLIARFDSLPSFSKSIPIFIYTVSRTFSDQNYMNQIQKAIGSGLYDKRYTLIDMSDEPGIGDAYHFSALGQYNAGNKTMQAIRNKSNFSNVFRVTQASERTLMYNYTTRIAKGVITLDSTTRVLYQFDGANFRSFGTSTVAGTGLTDNSGTFTNDLVTGKSGGGNIYGGTGSGQVLNINGTTAGNGKVNIGSGTVIQIDEAFNVAQFNSAGKFGIGRSPTAQFDIYQSDANGGNNLKMENAGVSSGSKYLTLGVNGSTAYGVTGWANAALFESTTPGGVVVSAYDGTLKFQTGNARTTRFNINASGTVQFNGLTGSITDMATLDASGNLSRQAIPLASQWSAATGGINYSGGKVGIGTASPTASLHLPAGSATAGTAPLKFTTGTVLTTAEQGAVEWNSTSYALTFSKTNGNRSKFQLINSIEVVSSTFTVDDQYSDYISTAAVTTTFTLPALTPGKNSKWTFKNASAFNMTVQSNAGGNDLYTTTNVSSVVLTPGQAYEITGTGNKYYVK